MQEWTADHNALVTRHREQLAEQSVAHAAEQQRRVDEWRQAQKASGVAGETTNNEEEEVPDDLIEPFVPLEPEWDGTFRLDTTPFVLPFAKTRTRVEDHVEHCRRKLVRCMKAGGTAIVDIGALAPDFVNKVLRHNKIPL